MENPPNSQPFCRSRDGRPPHLSCIPDFFFFRGKKTWARQVDYFFIGEKMAVWWTLLQTCYSSRFNQDIPTFQYKFRGIPISLFHVWKSHFFCFVWKLEKQKGVSCCRMSHVSKPTKFGLKINFMIGWIDGLGWILCTPGLNEWNRLGLASFSCRPSLRDVTLSDFFIKSNFKGARAKLKTTF